MVNKKLLTEKEIRDRFITPAIVAAGWDRVMSGRDTRLQAKSRVAEQDA